MRYRTTLSGMAVLVWSLLFSVGGFGQPLKYDKPTSIFTFEIPTFTPPPPPLTHDPSRFGVFEPFYNAFMIFGDGNFSQINGSITPLTTFSITHPYISLDEDKEYPVLAVLIDRKTSNEPPEEQQFVRPDGNGTAGVEASGASPGGDDEILISAHPPMVISTTPFPERRMAMEFSHFWIDPLDGLEKYFLKERRISAFPIAYKPYDGEGLLLFFYNNDLSSDHFEYMKNYPDLVSPLISAFGGHTLSYDDTGTDFPGTYLPNYYGSTGLAMVSNKANSINIQNVENFYNNSVDPAYSFDKFKYVLPHTIDLMEGNTDITENEELRLFHLIKTGNLDFLENKNHYFLAALYGPHTSRPLSITYSANYNQVKSDLEAIESNPISDFFDDRPFIDAQLLGITHGEPDDPNKLEVTNICKCNGVNEYVVTFNLEFCNEDPDHPATGASIILKDLNALFSDFNLIRITPESSECIIRSECNDNCFYTFSREADGYIFSEANGGYDYKFCVNFNDGKTISGGECANIYFTVKMAADDIEKLTKRSLWYYCVHLKGVPDAFADQELCKYSDVLNPINFEYEVIDTNQNLAKQSFSANQIWTDKDDDCPEEKGCMELPPTPLPWCKWWLCFLVLAGFLYGVARWRGWIKRPWF